VNAVGLFSSIAVCGVLAASGAHARCRMTNVVAIPVAEDSQQLVTRGAIDGRSMRVLIDTGSNASLIWRSAVERLGLHVMTGPRMRMLGLGGESYVDATFVHKLQVGSVALKNVRVPVAGDLPIDIDFILGGDLLVRGSVEFDVRHGVVRTMQTAQCSPAELPYWAETYSMADLIGSPRDTRAVRLEVLLNGHRVRAQIDSGSSLSFVGEPVTDAAGVRYVDHGLEVVGIGQHSLKTWIAEVDSVKVGDEIVRGARLLVASLGKYQTMEHIGSRIPVPAGQQPEMLLGMDFLRAHHVLIDNATRKMVFTYEGGPVFQIDNPAAPDATSSDQTGPLSADD